MKIDKKLNIVIPIVRGTTLIPIEPKEGDAPDAPKGEEADNIEGYVFAMPLTEGAFEANFEIIARAYTRIFAGGLGVVGGPRTAAMILRQVAAELNLQEKLSGLQLEIRRLSMFATMTANGWEQIPMEEAIKKNLLDPDELSEVDNALAFFIVASAMSRRSEMRPVMLGMASFWGTLPISSTFTDFLAFLKTSTKPAPSIEKPAASSVPR